MLEYGIMKGFELTPEQAAELRAAHRATKEKRVAYKINAVILLGTGWTLEQVSQALLLDEETLRTYVGRYKQGGAKKLLKSLIGGRFSILTDDEKTWLIEHVEAHLYARVSDLRYEVKRRLGKSISGRSLRRVLNELGFSYKKTKLVPGKADAAKQQSFIEQYHALKSSLTEEDAIYFLDSVHPTHNAESGYAWVKTGEERYVKSNTGRTRININGAVDIHRMHVVATQSEMTNSQAIIRLLKKIEKRTKVKGTIHLILDNARYHHALILKDFIKGSRFKLHYLPPYSPNLNPIERLWKFMKGEVIKNQYYEKIKDFKKAITQFFQYFSRYRHRLQSTLTDNFRVVQLANT